MMICFISQMFSYHNLSVSASSDEALSVYSPNRNAPAVMGEGVASANNVKV